MSRRRHAAVVAAAAVVSWWVASPGVGRLDDHIVGDNGDAMWQLSVMRWTLDALQSLRLPWTPPMYFPTTGTYAYSDPMLTQAMVAAPLRALGTSPAFVANGVLLIAWTAGVYLAWRLLRRVTASDAVAFAGAIAWAFSELRIATVVLFQIITAAALLPFVFERLFATLVRPTAVRGLVLGFAMAAAVLAALYYGPLLATSVPVAVIVWFAVSRRRPTRGHLVAGAIAVVVTGLAVLPLAVKYQDIHDRDGLHRSPESEFSADVADLTKVSSRAGVLADLPGLSHADSGERALFPGLFVVAALPVGVLLLLLRRRDSERDEQGSGAELAALVAAGAIAYALATGGPLGLLDGLPGFEGIRAPVRFAIFGHLGLVALATWVIGRVVARLGTRAAVVAVAALVAVSLVDSGARVPAAPVPDEARWSTVNRRLRDLPKGPVAELPVMQSSDGVAWPRVEAPRLYLAAIDDNRRVNGYSGFQPPDFDLLASTLNSFPAEPALEALRRLEVRYVVLRTDIVGRRTRARRPMLAVYGTTDERRLVATVPMVLPDGVRALGRFGSAVLIELEP